MTEFACELLGKQHDRQRFRCESPELEEWLKQRARQDQQRRAAAVHVLVPVNDPTRIAGFYTLSASSVKLIELPEGTVRKLPRYSEVPAFLLGRLARDLDFPGVGTELVMDALYRAWRHAAKVAAALIVVDAKNERAVEFYRRFDFQPVIAAPNRLFLPMSVLDKTFKGR